MVQDVLGLKLNKVVVQEGGSGPSQPSQLPGKKVAYDVDEKDFFWEACGSYPFPRSVPDMTLTPTSQAITPTIHMH
jgi:hypothetical protein